MRKFFSLLLALALLCPAMAFAEPAALEEGVLTELFDGDVIDIDGDGVAETIGFTTVENESEGNTSFRLTIGKVQLDGEGDWLTGRLHALRMPESASDDTLFFVSDYGMSDDDLSYVFSYYQGQIASAGAVGTMPWDLAVTGPKTLSGQVRGRILCTWWRPCEYVLGVTSGTDEEYNWVGRRVLSIAEVPKSEYAMGFHVTVTRDLPLQVSRTNPSLACVVPAGSSAIIAATDDIEWLYIQPTARNWEYDFAGGWLRVADYGYKASVGGETIQTAELFTGLLYAD